MLRNKFLMRLLIWEYVSMIIILQYGFNYENVKRLHRLEELNMKQQEIIKTLSDKLNKQTEESDIVGDKLKVKETPIEVKEVKVAKTHKAIFRVTAYCACEKCCGKWAVTNGGGITASGTRVKEGRTIAVYTKQIPFGTEVYIEGMGTYIAEDTGSAIKENCIDIYFDSHEEALKFGVKYLTVEW